MVAILVALAGLLFPVIGSSMRQAKVTADSEHLRQIGAAAALYMEAQGKPPLSVLDFKDSQLWLSPLWESGTDPFRKGFRNELLEWLGEGRGTLASHYLKKITPQKVSYVGMEDLLEGNDELKEKVFNHPNAGWLLGFGSQDLGRLQDPGMVVAGAFIRLNFDGSVVRRPSQKLQDHASFVWMFCDFSNEEKLKDKVP